MAVLTATGILFSVGNELNSKYGIIPQTNSPMVFIQSAAPTGWTRVAQNDKTLRVVTASSTGGTAGGTNAFSNTFISQTLSASVPVTINGLAMNNTTIDQNTMAVHSHPVNGGGLEARNGPSPSQGTSTGAGPGAFGSVGNGGAHAHPLTYTSASGPGSAPLNMAIQYVDCNICQFD